MFSKLTRICLFSLIAALFFVVVFAQAEPIKFARYPHICGGKIAFSYHGDIWIAKENGSNPQRLTAHVARDIYPRFSPDGKWIAFSSDRMGNNDVFVIPVEGGEPRQLTFATTNDDVLYWTPDGKGIIVATSRGMRAWGSPLYIVSVGGGLPMPMDMDFGSAGMIKQDGSMVAFNRFGFRYWRKGYKGNANTDISVQDLKTKKITQLTDTDLKQFRNFRQDANPMWGADGQIYFMSERDDIFNIWKISPSGGSPVQVTFHKKDGVQYPAMSPDGKVMVYENEFELWKLGIPAGKPEKISLDLAFDPKENMVEFLPAEGKADGFGLTETGDYAAVDYHGEIFIVPTEQGIGEMKQVTASPWRDRFQDFSPDGKSLAYISDQSLEEEIWLYSLDSKQHKKLTTHPSTKNSFVWSKDSKQIAFSAANKLFTIDVAAGQMKEIDTHEAGGFSLHEFSPDGKWLVLTMRDDEANADVYLYDIAAKKAYDVTPGPFRDSGGTLTPDAKYLIFASARNNGVNHLFKVSLAKLNEDPDDPLVKERLKKEEKPQRKETKEGAAPPPSITVNLEGIDRRAVQITTGTNPVGAYFLSKDGQTIYFMSSDEQGPALFSITIDGKDRKKVVEGTFRDLMPTADRKMVFYRQDNNLYKMDLANKKKEKINFNFTVTVDRRAEWNQIFEESWRVMKYRFYDPKMHGKDWDAIKGIYKPLLKYVGDNQDIYDISNEMIGELNASHTGVSGPTREAPPTYRTRYLGFEMEPDKSSGLYRISHIYRKGPADKEWLNIREGDYVFALDGATIKAGDNYWKLLNGTLNEYVTVSLGSEPDPKGKTARSLRMKTVPSLMDIRYEEWVEGNRDYVDKISEGKIAYVHIRSMNQPSLARFQNEINQFANKKGIVVDIRYNGGGNIDQEILDILERRPYEFWNSRWGARTWGRRPSQAIAGPKVMLINWRSASDSEVTPMGFRDLGLGRIVGNPTNASVIATGSYSLINGGSIRTPGSLVVTYDPTKPNNYGINLENYGVAPDVFVRNTPEDELKGFDRELKTAVDEALKMLKEGKWQYER